MKNCTFDLGDNIGCCGLPVFAVSNKERSPVIHLSLTKREVYGLHTLPLDLTLFDTEEAKINRFKITGQITGVMVSYPLMERNDSLCFYHRQK